MSHNIYARRIAYNDREIPWHQFGKPFSEGTSLETAFQMSKCDYKVVIAEATAFSYQDENGIVQQVSTDNLDLEKKSYTVLRVPSFEDKKYAVLGDASERFGLLQNRDLISVIKPLEQFGPVDVIGSLDEGARFFVTLRGNAWKIDGDDPIDLYLVVKNTHLPGETLQMQLTCVRVLCKNTWVASDGSNEMDIRIHHHANIQNMTEWAVTALAGLPVKIQRVKEKIAKMKNERFYDFDWDAVLDDILPLPKESKAAENWKMRTNDIPELQIVSDKIDTYVRAKENQHAVKYDRIDGLRKGILQTWRESETVDRTTKWGAFNAITEGIQWVSRLKYGNRISVKAQRSNFDGEHSSWKAKAWDILSK